MSQSLTPYIIILTLVAMIVKGNTAFMRLTRIPCMYVLRITAVVERSGLVCLKVSGVQVSAGFEPMLSSYRQVEMIHPKALEHQQP